jgi:hypothetical protein
MTRVRSPNYPLIGLEGALKKVEQLHKAEAENPVPKEAVAKLIGFSGINGRSLKVVSALLKYKLLEKRKGDDLGVSKLAVRILYPNDEVERQEDLKIAAYSPILFSEIMKNSRDGTLPSDKNLEVQLIRRGFNQKAVEPFIKSFRETMGLLANPSPDMDPVEEPCGDGLADVPKVATRVRQRPQLSGTVSADDVDSEAGVEERDSESAPAVRQLFSRGGNVSAYSKPIVFDTETVSGSYVFNNSDDLTDFIEKLKQIRSLLPPRRRV